MNKKTQKNFIHSWPLARELTVALIPPNEKTLSLPALAKQSILYQPAEVLTHEEWVNAGRYESLFGAPPPATRRAIPIGEILEESKFTLIGITRVHNNVLIS